MNNKIKLTVIVPVYNQEDYLDECMESIIKQDYSNLEIILIDDGSTDNSGNMCDEYGNKYENIRVIHKENSGLGLSRTVGIKNANGKYIFFLDADDCLDGTAALSEMTALAEEKDSDIVVGCYKRFNRNWVSEINNHHLREGEYTETFDFRFNGFYKYGHLAYNWGKLYRTEFLINNNIFCKAYPFTQDKAHNMLCYAYKPKYSFYDKSCYLYRVNDSSVTFKYKKNFIPVWISIARDFSEEIKQRKLDCDCDDLPAFHIFFGTFFLIKQELQQNGFSSSVKALRKYMENEYAANSIRLINKEKYADKISDLKWRTAIKMASKILNLHWYRIYVFAVWIIRSVKIDYLVTKLRYINKK